MSLLAMKKMIDPYLGSVKTLPHKVAVNAIASANDGGVVSPLESAKLFDALRKPADQFEVTSDRQDIGTVAVSAANTPSTFDALSFLEKRRITNSIFRSQLNAESGKVGAYSVSKSQPMARGMKYTDALVKAGFPLAAAQKTAKYLTPFLRDNAPGATVTCRLVTLGGKVVATEAFADGGSQLKLLLRFSPTGEQYMRHSPYIA